MQQQSNNVVFIVNEGQRGVEHEVVGLFLENVFFLTIKILQIKLFLRKRTAKRFEKTWTA